MRTLVCIGAALAVAALASDVAAGDGGPAPGATLGWDGVKRPQAQLRYVALPGGATTTALAAVRVRDGRVVRFNVVRGVLGVPTVAFDGTTDGVSADGRRLVLTSAMGGRFPVATRLVVVRLPTLRPVRTIALPGLWAFDAISPDGATIYALEYGSADRYSVRVIDARTGKVDPQAIVDRREPDETMRGTPIARAWSADRRWAYTLYAKPNGTAFVHGLDTVRRAAVCIDLPWRAVGDAIWQVKLQLAHGGRTVTLRSPGVGLVATVDLRTRVARMHRSLHD
jgi:hypothetical protein